MKMSIEDPTLMDEPMYLKLRGRVTSYFKTLEEDKRAA